MGYTKKEVLICDRCGKEEEFVFLKTNGWYSIVLGTYVGPNESSNTNHVLLFCQECRNKFWVFAKFAKEEK